MVSRDLSQTKNGIRVTDLTKCALPSTVLATYPLTRKGFQGNSSDKTAYAVETHSYFEKNCCALPRVEFFTHVGGADNTTFLTPAFSANNYSFSLTFFTKVPKLIHVGCENTY